MTPLGKAAVKQLALKVLANYGGSGKGARAVAAAAQRAHEDLVRVSAPLIGQGGIDALTRRTVYLAQRKYPWLAQPGEPDQDPFTQVISRLERQDSAVATDAAAAMLATLAGLLGAFIGEHLTANLLRKAWPGAFSDTGTSDAKIAET
jgi:hypothetical protein